MVRVSKKLTVAILSILLVALNRKLGLGLEPSEITSLAGLVAAYLIGQGIADHGAQGAAKAAEGPDPK